ncbi:MAG: hypothetical protein ACFB02_07925 [Mastigocoleus sp.]
MPKAKKHTVRFEMLLTEEQNDNWQILAESCGISKAELVRRRMSGCRIKTIPQLNWTCYWKLLEISKDINRIAKAQDIAVTNGQLPPSIDSIPFKDLLEQISKLRLSLVVETNGEIESDMEDSDDW